MPEWKIVFQEKHTVRSPDKFQDAGDAGGVQVAAYLPKNTRQFSRPNAIRA